MHAWVSPNGEDFLHHADTFIQVGSACGLYLPKSDVRGCEGCRGGGVPMEVVDASARGHTIRSLSHLHHTEG